MDITIQNSIDYHHEYQYLDYSNLDYNKIIQEKNFIKIDIVFVDELSGNESVGYIKTFWIKLIQRRWKKIYKQRQDILKQRMLPRSIRERQLTGNWPKGLRIWPKGFR